MSIAKTTLINLIMLGNANNQPLALSEEAVVQLDDSVTTQCISCENSDSSAQFGSKCAECGETKRLEKSKKEAFRIRLNREQAYKVRNCRASMWNSFVGGLVRPTGNQLPDLYSAGLEGNELVIYHSN